MNWWLILFIVLIFIGSMLSFLIGWFAGRKYQKIYDKESKDE